MEGIYLNLKMCKICGLDKRKNQKIGICIKSFKNDFIEVQLNDFGLNVVMCPKNHFH